MKRLICFLRGHDDGKVRLGQWSPIDSLLFPDLAGHRSRPVFICCGRCGVTLDTRNETISW